jgi:hypothetical protein
MEKGCSRLSSDLEIGTSHSLASRLPYNPQRWNFTLAATASITQRPRGRIVKLSRSATSDRVGDEERLH